MSEICMAQEQVGLLLLRCLRLRSETARYRSLFTCARSTRRSLLLRMLRWVQGSMCRDGVLE
eukprot:6292039-Amphidinium_carterae.1